MLDNIGTVDKIFRVVSGAIMIAPLYLTPVDLFPTSTATVASAIIGALVMSTSLTKICPLCHIVGVRTSRIVEK